MATRLIQIVPFTAVPASGTVALPHQINVNGVPEKPDFVAADTAGFTVTVTAAQVSVTNNGASPASVNVWLELKHTTSRQLGTVPDTLYPSLIPRPFVVASGGGSGGGGSTYAFVYQPGGTPHDNVFDDWTLLDVAMSAISGPKLLQFDDQFAALSIPAGTWDQTSTVWEGRGRGPGLFATVPVVSMDDGVELIGLREVHGLYLQSANSGVAPISDMTDGDVFILDDNTIIGGDGGSPIIDLANVALAKSVRISVRHDSQIRQQSPILVPGIAIDVNVEVDKFALVEANTFDDGGAGAATLTIYAKASNNVSVLQSFFGGTVRQIADISALNPVINQQPLELSPGMMAYYPFGNVTAVNLPRAEWHPGAMIVVKNSSGSANAITITPSPGNTVNGAATYVIALAQGSAILVSDGVSNWMVVAKF